MLEDKETYKLLKKFKNHEYLGQKYFNKHPFNNDSLHFLKRNGFVEEANIKSENWSYKITIKGKNELVKSFRTKIGFYLSIFAIVLSIIAIIVSIIALI